MDHQRAYVSVTEAPFSPYILESKLTATYSDSQNPELAAKQILSIAPILDGQKENSQFQIPPHAPKQEDQPAPSASEPVDVKNTGSGTGSEPSEAPQPSAQPSTQPSSQAKNSVERKDSRTSEVDEYVDAEDCQEEAAKRT